MINNGKFTILNKINDYTITEILSEKRLFRKQEVISYKLYNKDGVLLAIKKNKDDFDEIIVIYEKYKSDPIYKVFKLGSGEFQIFQKIDFQRNGNWYYPILRNAATTTTPQPPEYFDTLDAACKKLLEYEKRLARKIKEPVECI